VKVYGFGTLAGSIVGGYTSLEDAQLIGGRDAPLFVREVGPWEDLCVNCGNPEEGHDPGECTWRVGSHGALPEPTSHDTDRTV